MMITREQLQCGYILWDFNQMSEDDFHRYFVDRQNAYLDCLNDDELFEEVRKYAPHLIK
jgi:hypothetical protein